MNREHSRLTRADFDDLGDPWHSRSTVDEILARLPEIPSFAEPIEAVRDRVDRRIGPMATPWDPRESPSQRRVTLTNDLLLAVARAGASGSCKRRDPVEIVIQVHSQQVCLTLLPIPRADPSHNGNGASPPSTRDILRLSILETLGTERIGWTDEASRPLESRIREIAVEVVTTAEIQHREGQLQLHAWRDENRARLEAATRKQDAEAERRQREHESALASARVNQLLRQAEDHGRASHIRAYVQAVASGAQSSAAIDQDEWVRWRTWALHEADRIDPIASDAGPS